MPFLPRSLVTTTLGFERDVEADEIVRKILVLLKWQDEKEDEIENGEHRCGEIEEKVDREVLAIISSSRAAATDCTHFFCFML